jgi:hypothetical protein
MSDRQAPDGETGPEPIELPVEVEIYIEADGSVTFADLAADVAPIANELNPEQPLACEPPDRPAGSSASGSSKAEGEEREGDA